jgi:ankyrin repeat protein
MFGGLLEVVKYLAEQQKVNTEATDMDGSWTALHCACNKGKINIVKYLLEEQHVEKDVLINLTDQSPLHVAIVSIERHLNVIKCLVEEHAYDIAETCSE